VYKKLTVVEYTMNHFYITSMSVIESF